MSPDMNLMVERIAAYFAMRQKECDAGGHKEPVYFQRSSRDFSPYEDGFCNYCGVSLKRPRTRIPDFYFNI